MTATTTDRPLKFQIQLRWATHSKGPDFWQTMNGLYKRENAEAAVAEAMASGDFLEGRVVPKGTVTASNVNT